MDGGADRQQVKCDETKPGCQTCSRRGSTCLYQQQPPQWSTKHERPTQPTAAAPEYTAGPDRDGASPPPVAPALSLSEVPSLQSRRRDGSSRAPAPVATPRHSSGSTEQLVAQHKTASQPSIARKPARSGTARAGHDGDAGSSAVSGSRFCFWTWSLQARQPEGRAAPLCLRISILR